MVISLWQNHLRQRNLAWGESVLAHTHADALKPQQRLPMHICLPEIEHYLSRMSLASTAVDIYSLSCAI